VFPYPESEISHVGALMRLTQLEKPNRADPAGAAAPVHDRISGILDFGFQTTGRMG